MSKASEKTAIELYVIGIVKEMREGKKMSQSELATRLEMSNGFIGQVESPKFPAKYNLNHINELAKIFGCSPKDFLPNEIL